MILDKLENVDLYRGLNPLFAAAFDYLQKTDLNQLAPGRYEIQGKEVYAIVQEYPARKRDQGRWEAHRNYVDLQLIVSGEEVMGFANLADLRSLSDYDAAKDVEHLEGEGIFFNVPQGFFTIFGTRDAHMPCLEPGRPANVRKVVLKIRDAAAEKSM